jgi:hypothetical protein
MQYKISTGMIQLIPENPNEQVVINSIRAIYVADMLLLSLQKGIAKAEKVLRCID